MEKCDVPHQPITCIHNPNGARSEIDCGALRHQIVTFKFYGSRIYNKVIGVPDFTSEKSEDETFTANKLRVLRAFIIT